jgi:aspartate kinase
VLKVQQANDTAVVDPSADGTVVRRNPPRMPGTVVGVASERDVLLLESDAPAEALLAALDACGVAGKQLHVASGRATLVISRENLHDEARVREVLDRQLSGRARLVDGLGAVSVIGAGINATYRNLRAGSGALAAAGIEPAAVATSSFRITWMIPRARADEAVRLLHGQFIDSEQPLLP